VGVTLACPDTCPRFLIFWNSRGPRNAQMGREQTSLADIPIIFFSAYFTLPPQALELANVFITKGDPPEVLIEKIEQLM